MPVHRKVLERSKIVTMHCLWYRRHQTISQLLSAIVLSWFVQEVGSPVSLGLCHNVFISWNGLKQPSFLTPSWPAGHVCPPYKESFQVRWDNSIPLFLHAAIYLEVSLFLWTSQNAFPRETAVYKWYCVQCCIAALHTVSFVRGCFAGKCILTGSKE